MTWGPWMLNRRVWPVAHPDRSVLRAPTPLGIVYLNPTLYHQNRTATIGNSIAFGSAPRREADSQPHNQKIHWGMVLLGKIMILQGVGHPISCLGVCYANDPQKGGYTTPAPALDLTTSLRGDFFVGSFSTMDFGKLSHCTVICQLMYPGRFPKWVHYCTYKMGTLLRAPEKGYVAASIR